MKKSPKRKQVPWLAGVLAALTCLPAWSQPKFDAAVSRGIAGQYLVQLAPGATRRPDEISELPAVASLAEALAEAYGGRIIQTWEHAVQGFLVRMREAEARSLAADPRVKTVRQDRIVAAVETLPPSCYGFQSLEEVITSKNFSQTITCDDPDPRNPNRNCSDNWGLDRIDQVPGTLDQVYGYTQQGTGVHVYVLDTGILSEHSDFAVFGPPFSRVVGGYNAITGTTSNTTDCHGHGTHVAGIIGGKLSGVAKGAWLHPVKVLDTCPGQPQGGQNSHMVAGLNWIRGHHNVATMGPAVVNWSGGNGSGSSADPLASADPLVQQAVANLLAAGISLVQSAGNQKDVYLGQPTSACARSLGGAAGLDSVLVVGGTDLDVDGAVRDGRWIREANDPSASLCTGPFKDCGSNSGSCVDLWAPAAHIISADRDDPLGFCRLSGTSMAAPHVTGAVAQYLQSNPAATPAQIRAAMVGGATCGMLDLNPTSPYFIGASSPDLLLNTRLNGGGPALCEPSLSDSFAGSGPLSGRTTETGGVVWAGRPAALVSGGRVSDAAALGGLPFEASTLPGQPQLRLLADVNPASSGWAAVGFSSQPTTAFWSAGQLWVLLRPTGTFAVNANGSGATLASGTIPGSPSSGFHRVEIVYETATGLATVALNGSTVLAAQPLGFSPNIRYSAFHFHQAAEGGGRVDNLEVRVNGATQLLDTFTGSGALNGRLADQGGVSWSALAGAQLSAGSVTDGAAIAGLPIDARAWNDRPTMVVTASVNPAATEWVGVGLANSATNPYWSAGQLWVLLRPGGTYAVNANGTALSLGSGTIPGTPVNGFHLVEVRWDRAQGRATVRLNQVEVVSSQPLSLPSLPTFAGFHLYRAAQGTGNLDSFQLVDQ